MQNNYQNNQPLDKGRVAFVADTYQTRQMGQNNQPVMKNRYATLGRATKWAGQQGENIELEIDAMPVNQKGPLKLVIFWDSQSQQNQQQPPQQYQQQQTQQHQQNNGYQYGNR